MRVAVVNGCIDLQFSSRKELMMTKNLLQGELGPVLTRSGSSTRLLPV